MILNKTTLAKKTSLTYDVVELRFKANSETSSDFSHKAGQFVSVKVPSPQGQIFRSYSISSKPTLSYFELCVKVVENGLASNFLANLTEGNEIEFLGPLGNFGFIEPTNQTESIARPNQSTPSLSLFIATGTGVAAFLAWYAWTMGKKGVLR